MILEQSGPLAPANEPWTLIRDAIHDLELQEKLKGVKINMDHWHISYDGVCSQCLGGSVMSRRLGADTDARADPFDYPDDVRDRLYALDNFRIGEIGYAYRRLKLERPDTLPKRVDVPRYRRGPSAFKAAMLKLADQLEAAQPTSREMNYRKKEPSGQNSKWRERARRKRACDDIILRVTFAVIVSAVVGAIALAIAAYNRS